jgi:uncharacterized protein with PIN domain
MGLAWFRFYEELNDFLPREMKMQQVAYSFSGNPSVKDAIEAIGVPHVEVDLILVNGLSVPFSHKLRDEDSVSVYPVFEAFDITSVTRLRETPLRELKFIADVHLGRLARYLRLCGFDTCYSTDYTDSEIISISKSERRAILTRDRELLKNKRVTHGYWVRSQHPDIQIKEVIERFCLEKIIKPFTRCMECNDLLVSVAKSEIEDRILPKTMKYYDVFKLCPSCMKIYWEGSHYEHMMKFLADII